MLKKLFLLGLMLSVTLTHARVNDMFAEEKEENLRYNTTIRAFMKNNEKITDLVHNAYAHVVFPTIFKGGAVLGYAWGDGRAYYRGGMWTANVRMTQYTIGAQLGGSAYSEIIFFKTREAFEAFKKGGLEDSTQLSLVPLYSGLSADVNFDDDVLVYTSSKGGLMLEATTGLQSFEYLQKK